MNTDKKQDGEQTNANTNEATANKATGTNAGENENDSPDMEFETEAEADQQVKAFTDEMDALISKYPKINALYIASASNSETEKTVNCIQQRGYSEPLASGIIQLLKQNPQMRRHMAVIQMMEN